MVFQLNLPGWEMVILIGMFVVFLTGSGIASFIILSKLRWNYKYELYENVSGNGYIKTKVGRARLISFGDGGEEIFYLKNLGKWRIAYGKRVGKNTVAWAVGQDGYWYNFTHGNLDTKLSELGVNPVDRDMRYAYASVRKGIEKRYDDKTFMDKYGTIIAFGMLFLCIVAMAGMMYFVFDKQKAIAGANAEGIKTTKEVMELAKQVLANVDNIKAGNSGAVIR